MRSIIYIIVAAVSICGCKRSSNEDVCIGAILPLTGPGAVFGKYNLEATRTIIPLLSEEYNIPIRIDIQDSRSTAKGAVNSYAALKNSGKRVVILNTEMSSVSSALHPFTHKDDIFLSGIAASEDLRTMKDGVLIYPGAAQLHSSLNKFLNDKGYAGSIAAYCINDDFGKSVIDSLASSGVSRRYACYSFDATTDVKSLVAKSKEECAFVCGYGSQFLSLIRELQGRKRVKFIVASPEFGFPEYYNSVDSTDENLYYIEFGRYDALSRVLRERMQRPINLIDFLVFSSCLSSIQVLREIKDSGNSFSSAEIFARVRGNTFRYKDFQVEFDSKGNVVFDLTVERASVLLNRR